MADRYLQPAFPCEGGQVVLPCPAAGVVGAAGVGGNQEPGGIRVVCPPVVLPPATDGLHRELGGVVVGSDVDPSGVVGDVVDPVGDRHRLVVGGERVAVHLDRVFARPPGATGPVTVPEPFLGLGVDADHRLRVVEEGGGGGI